MSQASFTNTIDSSSAASMNTFVQQWIMQIWSCQDQEITWFQYNSSCSIWRTKQSRLACTRKQWRDRSCSMVMSSNHLNTIFLTKQSRKRDTAQAKISLSRKLWCSLQRMKWKRISSVNSKSWLISLISSEPPVSSKAIKKMPWISGKSSSCSMMHRLIKFKHSIWMCSWINAQPLISVHWRNMWSLQFPSCCLNWNLN